MYVIQRFDGAYVTKPGSRGSYTRFLEDARIFTSRESAERELCPRNETIVKIEEILS